MKLTHLRSKNSILLLTGQLVSMLGTYMQLFALSLYVLDITNSATKFSYVILLGMIPRIILGPFAGVLADRVSRKKLIVSLDMLSGAITFMFVALLYRNQGLNLTQIYIFTILLGTITVLFEPATAALIPDIVEKERLGTVNSMRHLILTFSTILAPLLGGILYPLLGLIMVMIINGISFVLSSVSEMFITPPQESLRSSKQKEPFFKLLAEGIVFLKHNPIILILTVSLVIMNFTVAPVSMIAFPYILRQDLQIGDYLFGIARSLMMVGPILGSLLAGRLMAKYDFKKTIPVLIFISGISFILAAVTVMPNMSFGIWVGYFGIIFSSFVLGASVAMASIISVTTRQKYIPGQMMGRISAVISTFLLSSIPIGQALMGRMLDSIPAYICIMIFAVLVLLSSLIASILFKKTSSRGSTGSLLSTPTI